MPVIEFLLLASLSLCAAAPLNPTFDKPEIASEDTEEDSVAKENHETNMTDLNANREGKFRIRFGDIEVSNAPFDVSFGSIKVTNTQGTDGGWSNWSGFGSCSATCGAATKKRERTCLGGAQCPGSNQDIVNCNLSGCVCPADKVTSEDCLCENGISGAKQSCSSNQGCTSNGICLDVCTDDGTKSPPCFCKSRSSDSGVACSSNKGCAQDGSCPGGISQKDILNVKINEIDENIKAIGELTVTLQNIEDGLKALASTRQKRSNIEQSSDETKLLELIDQVNGLVEKCGNGDSCDSNKIKDITQQITSTFNKVEETGTVSPTFQNSFDEKKTKLDTAISTAVETQVEEKAKVLTDLALAVSQATTTAVATVAATTIAATTMAATTTAAKTMAPITAVTTMTAITTAATMSTATTMAVGTTTATTRPLGTTAATTTAVGTTAATTTAAGTTKATTTPAGVTAATTRAVVTTTVTTTSVSTTAVTTTPVGTTAATTTAVGTTAATTMADGTTPVTMMAVGTTASTTMAVGTTAATTMAVGTTAATTMAVGTTAATTMVVATTAATTIAVGTTAAATTALGTTAATTMTVDKTPATAIAIGTTAATTMAVCATETMMLSSTTASTMAATTTAAITLAATTTTGATSAYCSISLDHTMCKYSGPSDSCRAKTIKSGLSDTDKQAIVNEHNRLRRRVAKGRETRGKPGPQPGASDMLLMVWDDELAMIAQRWADQCTFGHDDNRDTKEGEVGQNVAMMSVEFELADDDLSFIFPTVTTSWYEEVHTPGFNKDHVNPFVSSSSAAHYTQVVWASSRKVGCGSIYYNSGDTDNPYNLVIVCNYFKGGNQQGGAMYSLGNPCSACPSGYQTRSDGLCDL